MAAQQNNEHIRDSVTPPTGGIQTSGLASVGGILTFGHTPEGSIYTSGVYSKVGKSGTITPRLHKRMRTKGKKYIYNTELGKCGSCGSSTKMNSTCLKCMEKITERNREKSSRKKAKFNSICICCRNTKPNMKFNYYFLSTKTRNILHKHRRLICNDCLVYEFLENSRQTQSDSDYEDFETHGGMGMLSVDQDGGDLRENIVLSVAGIKF
jgi:hypothetical protein